MILPLLDLWEDAKLGMLIVIFVYCTAWVSNATGSKFLAILITAVLVLGVLAQNTVLLVLMFAIMFGYATLTYGMDARLSAPR